MKTDYQRAWYELRGALRCMTKQLTKEKKFVCQEDSIAHFRIMENLSDINCIMDEIIENCVEEENG